MTPEQRARREALGIPVHEETEHVFVDGYCTCGQREQPEPSIRGKRTAGGPYQAKKPNLDAIEGNWSEYR